MKKIFPQIYNSKYFRNKLIDLCAYTRKFNLIDFNWRPSRAPTTYYFTLASGVNGGFMSLADYPSYDEPYLTPSIPNSIPPMDYPKYQIKVPRQRNKPRKNSRMRRYRGLTQYPTSR